MLHTIKIENISSDDYQRLQSEAAVIQDAHGKPLSLRNYVRLLLMIAPAKRGNPTGNKGKRINQPKRRQQNETE